MAIGFFPIEAFAASQRVSFPFTPSPLRLYSQFTESDRRRPPIVSDREDPPWLSIDFPLLSDFEATSARFVGKGLGPSEAVAWELFPPIHRVLLVALIAIASAESNRSRRILHLQRSVDIRDEVLKNMQLKLDHLLEQMASIKDYSSVVGCNFPFDIEQIKVGEMLDKNEAKLFHCGYQGPDLNPNNCVVPICHPQSIKTKDVSMMELCEERLYMNNHAIVTEQEERRMSDLSDFCWSIASSVDTQLNSMVIEQELSNLRTECREKNAAIKELTSAAHSASVTYSKRITELEDEIRRKNMIITNMKKDLSVFEQQIVKLTRLRRPSCYSSSSPSADLSSQSLLIMTENILYDMSSASASSSDCDSPHRTIVEPLNTLTNETPQQSLKIRMQDMGKAAGSSLSPAHPERSPLKENRVTRNAETNAPARSRSTSGSSVSDQKKPRKRNLQGENRAVMPKKWL